MELNSAGHLPSSLGTAKIWTLETMCSVGGISGQGVGTADLFYIDTLQIGTFQKVNKCQIFLPVYMHSS